MAEQIVFPRILYAATEPTGHLFESQAEVDAAGGTWFVTPTEAADAVAKPAPPASSPEPQPSDEGSSTPRSRR